jgi:hypothetical protein
VIEEEIKEDENKEKYEKEIKRETIHEIYKEIRKYE